MTPLTWRERAALAWRYLRTYEPAAVIAFWRVVVFVAASLGLMIPAGVDGKVVAAVTGLSLLTTALATMWTRRRVVPEKRVEQLVTAARYQPPPA